MKYLNPEAVELARTIANVIPKTDDHMEKAHILTALSVLLFSYGVKMGISPGMMPLGIEVLAGTADEAMEELKNEGVNI